MNKLNPVWWRNTITVYNKFEDAHTQFVKWYRTVINNCFWKNTGEKVSIGQTVLETDGITCRIPQDERFKEKYQWINTPNDEMGNYFTLSVGDLIVYGDVSDEIDEYKSGKRSTDFISKYKDLQGIMQIQKVSINTDPVFVNPHYCVRGD